MTTINSATLESFNLLIIDPQNDFTLEDGTLSVPGAIADAHRLVKFMQEKNDSVNKIFVSLDTHTEKHIGHQKFWKKVDESGEDIKDKSGLAIHPDFYTIFDTSPTLQRIQDKTGRFYSPVDDSLYEYAQGYIKSFAPTKDADGKEIPHEKGIPLIWPTHCIEGTKGHQIYKPLETLLKESFSEKTSYYIKGQNELVEMYSIFKGEYENKDNKNQSYIGKMDMEYPSGDGKVDYGNLCDATIIKTMAPYLKTQFNKDGLFKELTKEESPIYIAGEALSHCVNWSLRDLVNNIKKESVAGYIDENGEIKPNKIYLIKNASSAIGGYKDNVTSLLEFCRSNNVQTVDIDDVAVITGGNRRHTRKSGKKRKNKSYKKNRRSRGKKSRK